MHFYRAILESIAYDHFLTREIMRKLLPRIPLDGSVTSIGSGAKSELWTQIKADVLQAPYETLVRTDLSTLGAAVLAGFAVGVFSGTSGTRGIAGVDRRVAPRPGADLSYRKNIEIYDELFRALKGVYRRMAS
jgi:xylulokinase